MKTPSILNKVGQILDKELKKNLNEQGHVNSGELEKSIVSRVNDIELNGEMLYYGNIVSDGVQSKRIPFRRGSGARTSKYIDGLVTFFKLKGLSEKEAKGAAFATANVHKREGMSTIASARFSKTGKRQRFIAISMEKKEKEINDVISKGMDEIFFKEFDKQKTETI